MSIFYNVAMDQTPGRGTVTLTQTSPVNFQVQKTFAWSTDGTVITVTPTSSLTPGARYTVAVEAFSATTQQQVNASFSFAVQADSTAPGAPTNLARDDDGALVGNNQVSFPIVFDGVPDGLRYTAYARRVDGIVPDWILATTINSSEPIVRATVTMPNALRQADSNTLFSAGDSYEIAVTATINGIESPLSAPMAVRDETCPLITAVVQQSSTGTWNNTTGEAALPISLRVTFDEFVDRAAVPTIAIDGNVLFPSDLTFSYLTGNTGSFVGEVDAGADASGLTLTINYDNVSDRSGNLNCETQIPVLRTTF
ncbi:MAG TPA: Ig-like domain-containing protein, partial [Myxococcota bacterium]